MKIACLGWGSLIWKPEALPLASEWFKDGPALPIEFSRVGDGGELATAVCMNAPLTHVFWAMLNADTLHHAVSALREREQIPVSRSDGVGVMVFNSTSAGPLAEWATEKQLDAVIWTALPPRIDSLEGRVPCVKEVLDYLATLEGEKRQHAQDYLRRVPTEFETPYRQAIRKSLGWVC